MTVKRGVWVIFTFFIIGTVAALENYMDYENEASIGDGDKSRVQYEVLKALMERRAPLERSLDSRATRRMPELRLRFGRSEGRSPSLKLRFGRSAWGPIDLRQYGIGSSDEAYQGN